MVWVQAVLAATTVLTFTLPSGQNNGSCGDGAPMYSLDSVRVELVRRFPSSYNTAEWVAAQQRPLLIVAQHSAIGRAGQSDGFVLARGDTGDVFVVRCRNAAGWGCEKLVKAW